MLTLFNLSCQIIFMKAGIILSQIWLVMHIQLSGGQSIASGKTLHWLPLLYSRINMVNHLANVFGATPLTICVQTNVMAAKPCRKPSEGSASISGGNNVVLHSVTAVQALNP